MDPNRNSNGMPYGNQGNNQNPNGMPYTNQGNNQNVNGMPYNNWNNNWNNDWNMMDYRGGIYYPDYGMDMENQSDIRYMKELYPELAKRIQTLVDEECDRMEYDGSMMYDEYPDRVMIYRIVRRILDQLTAEGVIELARPEDMNDMREGTMEANSVGAMQCNGNCCGGNCRNPQFEDLIQVILLNEIFKRRSNHRNRRRRYW